MPDETEAVSAGCIQIEVFALLSDVATAGIKPSTTLLSGHEGLGLRKIGAVIEPEAPTIAGTLLALAQPV